MRALSSEFADDSTKPIASRWVIFSSCLLVAGVCGLTTAFGLLSPSLEGDLDYSASEIALVASFGNLGTFSGFAAGLMIDHLGPRRAVFIGSGFIWFGLFFIWLSVEKIISSNVASLCIFIFIAQLGSATMSQGSSSTSMLIMPSCAHGEVASIAKAYYGIAGGVLSSIAGTYYEDKEKGFILFASLFMPLGTLLGGTFLDLMPEHMIPFEIEKVQKIATSFMPYYVHFAILVVFILITAALYMSDNSGGVIVHQFFGTIVIFLIIMVLSLKFLFYYPGSAKEGETEEIVTAADSNAENGSPLGRSSIIAEEVIKYEMQAQALAEHQLAKQHATDHTVDGRKSNNDLNAELMRSSDTHSIEDFDHRKSKMSQFRGSLAAQYKNKYGDDLTVRYNFDLRADIYIMLTFLFYIVMGNATNRKILFNIFYSSHSLWWNIIAYQSD